MFNLDSRFIFIGGPCVIEDEDMALNIAKELKTIVDNYPINFVFKASFDKANRTSIKSFRGPGLEKGLRTLMKIKDKLGIPILSDIHCVQQVERVKDVLDIIQIPAFLSRQTDLIIAAASTKKWVNIKKAQFMAPHDIKYVIEKVRSVGNEQIIITERGVCFGYHNLVVDFRSIPIMKGFGYPVIFDGTHSVQQPSAGKGVSRGNREFIPQLCWASVCCGCDGLFLEVHPNPREALSDSATSVKLKDVEKIIKTALEIKKVL